MTLRKKTKMKASEATRDSKAIKAQAALQASETQKNAILNGITTNIALVDNDLKIIWANKAAANSVNKLPEEMTGHTCHEFWANPAKPCENCPTIKAFKTKQSEHITIHTPDGRIWDEKGKPIFDKKGNVVAVVEIAQDITERVQAEEALRENETRYRSIINASPDNIAIMDLDGRILMISPVTLKMFGYKREDEILGRLVTDFLLPEDRERASSNVALMFQGTMPGPYEYRGLRADGSNFNIEVNAEFIRNTDGQPINMIIVTRDITERKKIEGTLRKNQVLLNEMGKMANIGGWEFSLDTQKQIWTEEIYRIHEVDMDYEPTVKKGIDFYAPTSRPIIERAVQRAMEHGEPFDLELELITAKGNLRWIHALGKLDRENGRVFGIFQDITEHKQAEEERNSLQEQLVRSEKLAAVGELIAGVVHEINNPLTGIKGLSELLLNETQDEEKKKDLKFIHQSSERIEKIVKNLQRFARREEPTRKNVNINELIDVVISIRNYEMKARNIKIEKHYQPDLPLVMADPSQLEQVFLNLILNAEDAIHDNQEKAGTLTIVTSVVPDSVGGETVVIEFSDTGPGIPSDVLPKLFNPFFTTKGVGQGTGLGLSISYGIIKGHGGDISAGNRAEGGAVFTIKLPVRVGKDDSEKNINSS